MRSHPYGLALLWALTAAGTALGQERLADLLADPATRISRPADRARIVARMAEIENNRRQNAHARATQLGLPLRTEQPNGRVQEIADFEGDVPIYLTTNNAAAAISTGADLLRTSPFSLSGAGVTVGVWDGGVGLASHREFNSRLIVMNPVAAIDHATHVAGTIIASGVDPSARGMANGATVHSYDWNSDVTEMTSRGATVAGEVGKIYVSNHSYGFISGWNPVASATRVWEWNGSATLAIEDDFGRYNNYARDSDSLAFNAPYYLIFRSAGNERTDNPATGAKVSLTPGGSAVVNYDPATHPAGDGNYRGGFETIGFNAVAKNVITVGSASDAVSGGLRNPNLAIVSDFSSWGPTDDGRIKPDVVANGFELNSPLSTGNAIYGVFSGTSMSTPNATGSATLLIQQYGNLFPGQAMRASTLKGLLIHTAHDLGNPGPDYKYGWGLINVEAAANLIRDHEENPVKIRLTEDQLTTSTVTRSQSFVWDGVSPVTGTLCWTDPAATALTTSDSRSPRLVNNLNLKIVAPSGSEFFPYVMPFVGTWTQASMNLSATTGINHTDNVEQVRIAAPPAAGTYLAVVTYSGTLVNNSQTYSLLISGSSAEPPPPPPLTLTAVSPNNAYSGPVTLDLSGSGFLAGTTVKLARAGQADIIATNVQRIGQTLRCQVNLTGAATGAWGVIATNPDLQSSTLAAAFTVSPAIWSENFDGLVTGWNSQANIGSNSWSLVTAQSKSPATSYFAAGPSTKSTTNLTSPVIPISPRATNLQLKFWHQRNFQPDRDCGKLEFSVVDGVWFDVESTGSGAVFASNGYNSTISSSGQQASRNEFAGQRAWSGSTTEFVETIVNLTDTAKYAGKNLRIRWRLATNNGTASTGWYLDNIALLGGVNLTNLAPVIATAATSSSVETQTESEIAYQVVRTTTTDLSVVATDDGGESLLNYTWAVTSGPPHPVFFSANASNAAKSTTADFEATGDYQLTVSVRDAQELTATSVVNVRVLQAAAGLIVSPATTTMTVGEIRNFSASLLDQFSLPMASQTASFTWQTSDGGSIDSSGVFTAASAGGPHVVTASSGAFSNTASISISPAPASVILSGLSFTYDGTPKTATVTTIPPNLAHTITYNSSSAEPVNTDSYAVQVSISNPNYQGTASATLVIGKATASIQLANLNPTYDADPKPVAVTTTPGGLAVSVTYDESAIPPTAVGTYAVGATVTHQNYQGSATGSLVISPVNDFASWGHLHFTDAEETAGHAADNADPDFDAWPNLAEYALGMNPRQFDPPLVATLDEDGLSVVFTRPASVTDVSHSAESSENLGIWTPIQLERLTPGTTETWRALDPLDSGNPALRFLRLRFVRP